MGKAGTVCWNQLWARHNELQNKITVILIEPVHTDDVLFKHSMIETMIRNGQMNIQRARKAQETIMETAVQGGLDMEAPMKLALLQNKIAQGELMSFICASVINHDITKVMGH
jgi:hypothetical protein